LTAVAPDVEAPNPDARTRCDPVNVSEPDVTTSLHPLLSSRWSPLRFDESHGVTLEEVTLLLEAARWAPSAGNSQPWSFVVGRRGDRVHDRLTAHLFPSSRRWAPTAAVLVANLSHRLVESTDWEFSEFSHYDLGQAVAHLTLQAQAMGLGVRQFRAFDRESLAAEFDVPAHWEVTSMAAIGRPLLDDAPPSGVESASRQRVGLQEILWVPLDDEGSLLGGGEESPA
jgi:nitroreductase